MITDYSEILAETPAKLVRLQNACRDKKWLTANALALEIEQDMAKLSEWLSNQRMIKHE